MERSMRPNRICMYNLLLMVVYFLSCSPCLADDILSLPSAEHEPQVITRGSLSYANATPLVISKSGVYKVTDAMSASGTNVITISANNVELDLGGNTLSNGTNGIVITGDNVTVKNGTIQNASQYGIQITGNQCSIEHIDVVSTATGFESSTGYNNSFSDCRALSNSSAGFSLVSSTTNNCMRCQAIDQSGSANVYGFVSDGGSANTFEQCVAKGCATSTTNSDYYAAGFVLKNSESTSSILNSSVTGIRASVASGGAYGIYAPSGTDLTIKNNTVSKVTSAASSGVGIRVDSSSNYVAGNSSCDSDTNYQDVSTDFTASQANARGVHNIDCSRTESDTVEVINSKIDVMVGCDYTPLTTDDISGGLITLDTAGNYCLSTDLTATVTITADNVCLCLNCRELTGRIIVDAADVTVSKGAVTAPAPTTSADAALAAVEVTSNGLRAHIENVTVVCNDTADAENDLSGRSGVEIVADDVIMRDCFVQGGMSGLPTDFVVTATGGYGVISSGDRTQIFACRLFSGDGRGITRTESGSIALNNKATGGGGKGLLATGSSLIVKDSTINGGSSGAIQAVSTGGGVRVSGFVDSCVRIGGGGDGVVASGDDALFDHCSVTAGLSGSITVTGVSYATIGSHGGASVCLFGGGTGIVSSGKACRFYDGTVTAGDTGGVNAYCSDGDVRVGSDGCCVTFRSAGSGIIFSDEYADVRSSTITAGSVGSIWGRAFASPATIFIGESSGSMTFGDGGFGIENSSNHMRVCDCTITAGDAGGIDAVAEWNIRIGYDDGQTTMGDGGTSIMSTGGNDTEIVRSTLTAGAAGDIVAQAGDAYTLSINYTGTAIIGDAGDAVRATTSASQIVLIDSLLTATDGGSIIVTANNQEGSLNGGAGGNGLACLNGSTNIHMRGCSVGKTGFGGAGYRSGTPNALSPGDGGDGGDGVFIESSCSDCEVRNCTFANTGSGGAAGGAGASAGVDGKAIDDNASDSAIFQNFAHDIANSIRFDLYNSGIEKGRAQSECHDYLDNIYDDGTGEIYRNCSVLDVIESKIDAINTDNEVLDSIDSKVDIVVDETWSIESKSEVISSKIDDLKDTVVDRFDTVDTDLDTIDSKLDKLVDCAYTPITADDISGGTITISQSGNYCLSDNLTADITISASDVCFCLNGYFLNGNITFSGVDRITIKDGRFSGASIVGASGVEFNNVRCGLVSVSSSIGNFSSVVVRDSTTGGITFNAGEPSTFEAYDSDLGIITDNSEGAAITIKNCFSGEITLGSSALAYIENTYIQAILNDGITIPSNATAQVFDCTIGVGDGLNAIDDSSSNSVIYRNFAYKFFGSVSPYFNRGGVEFGRAQSECHDYLDNIYDDGTGEVYRNCSAIEEVSSKLDKLVDCAYTPITSADIDGSGSITISQSGNYCLSDNLNIAAGAFTISASDVCFCLNGYTLFAAAHLSVSGSNVTIKNGRINNAVSFTGSSFTLKDCTVEDTITCNGSGFTIESCNTVPITCNSAGRIFNCYVDATPDSTIGITVNSQVDIYNCRILVGDNSKAIDDNSSVVTGIASIYQNFAYLQGGATTSIYFDRGGVEFGKAYYECHDCLDNIYDDLSGNEIYRSCSVIEEIAGESWSIESKCEVISSKVDVLLDCQETPLTSADISGGVITLDTAGNYCLSTDLTATVTITADNVCLCMNHRELTGVIIVDAADVLVKDGYVAPAGPVDADDAAQAAVEITSNGVDVRLTDLTVICADTTASGVAGRSAISVGGSSSIIEKCTVQSGAAHTGNAGDGIVCTAAAQEIRIRSIDIIGTGAGGTSNGDGGDGIAVTSGASDIEVRECTIAHTGAANGTGTDGKAIDDNHAASSANYTSVMYNNFAYKIANSTKYVIRNKGASTIVNGVNIISGSPGTYSNVYVP